MVTIHSLRHRVSTPPSRLEFKHVWIQRFGINVHLALDGLSLLMILLTGLLGILSVLCSWKEIQRHVGFFHLNLMWILGGVVGVFLALDPVHVFFFWEMMLVPMYFSSSRSGVTVLRTARKPGSTRRPSSSSSPRLSA